MIAKLKRILYTDEMTYGVLIVDNRPLVFTAELPWKENKKNISCIPIGDYTVKKVNSNRYGKAFSILNVPDRDHILFHSGNVPLDDSRGCVIVGDRFGVINDASAILSSRYALKILTDKMPDIWKIKII